MKKSILGLILLIGLSVPAHPQTPTAALPLEAQKDFDKGLAAAQQKEWSLAVKYFTQAANSLKYPKHPSVIFNLGLAHGKAGNDLSAIAWLHAYLAAEPQAPNTREVRKEIAGLQVSAEAKVQKMLQTAINAIEVMDNQLEKQKAKLKVAEALAEVGDLKKAKDVGTNAYVDPDYSTLYAKHLGMTGDFHAAGQFLRQIRDSSWYEWVYVCRLWLNIGDFESAKQCVRQIPITETYATQREDLIKTIAGREKMAQPNSLVQWIGAAEVISERDFVGDLKLAATPGRPVSLPAGIAQVARELNKELCIIQAREKFHSRQSR